LALDGFNDGLLGFDTPVPGLVEVIGLLGLVVEAAALLLDIELEGEEAWPLTAGFSLSTVLAGLILEEPGEAFVGFNTGLLGFDDPELIGLSYLLFEEAAAALLLDIGLEGEDA
jgi:hypothetical protein